MRMKLTREARQPTGIGPAQCRQLYTIKSRRKKKILKQRNGTMLKRCQIGVGKVRGNMKLLVISDSHGNYPHALMAHQLAGPVDHIIHLGDGADDARLMEQVLEVPVHRVEGNCDYDIDLPRELVLELGECRILLTHGNVHQVKSGLKQLIGRGIEIGANVVLYGHTHKSLVSSAEGMLLVNPGVLKDGMAGSYAIVTLEGATVEAEIYHMPKK
jgi:uncharacterized protein